MVCLRVGGLPSTSHDATRVPTGIIASTMLLSEAVVRRTPSVSAE